jgi:FlaA1/EpsC-like NDP-sugar epimerase
LEKRKTGVLPITDPEMTRFNISLEEGVDMVFFALEHSLGGEIFVPKIPSYHITEVAKAIGPDCEQPIVGIRPGEKVHEEMITSSDSLNTIEAEKYFVIVPSSADRNFQQVMAEYLKHYSAKSVTPGFRYSSGANDVWLSAEEIRALIKKYVDPCFEVA